MSQSMKNIIYVVATIAVVSMILSLSINGFFTGDDFAMRMGNNQAAPHRVSTLGQAVHSTAHFYKSWGGGLFAAFCQFVFCGVFGNSKLWFDVANTFMYAILVLLSVGIAASRMLDLGHIALFSLLYWFLLPEPHETLFWVTGAIGYLWATVPCLLWLLLFFRYKDDDFSPLKKACFFCLSVALATNLIFCLSVCGALVMFYAFRIKQLKGNALPLVVGFAVGTLILVFAPGNFVRAEGAEELFRLDGRFEVIKHPLRELFRYRALPLFLFAFLVSMAMRKKQTFQWMKNHVILLLALMWSVIAFSIVFQPSSRAMFSTEVLSVVLLVSLLSYQVANWPNVLPYGIVALLLGFVPDANIALSSTKAIANGNNFVMKQLVEQKGRVYANDMTDGHSRMALRRKYDPWAFLGMADALGLDSVFIFPEFCNPDLWPEPSSECEVQKKVFYKPDDGVGPVCVRMPEQCDTTDITIAVEYTKDQSVLREIRAHTIGYNYKKNKTFCFDEPFARFDGYSYYFVYLSIENARNITKIDVFRSE